MLNVFKKNKCVTDCVQIQQSNLQIQINSEWGKLRDSSYRIMQLTAAKTICFKTSITFLRKLE